MTTSTDNLTTLLSGLSQIQKVSLAQAVLARLATAETIRQAADTLDSSIGNDPKFKALTAEASADPGVHLDQERSVAVAETFLLAAATDADLAPLVTEELATFRDEKQFVVEALTLSACISLIIVAATTRIEYRGEKVTVVKETASPELVKAASSILNSVAP
jgi:hypothetical protein